MTQKEIAKLIKVDQNTITNWKKNKPELITTIIQSLIKQAVL